MRRLVFPVIVASGLVLIGSSSAFAEDPAPTVSAPAATPKRMCKITDKRLNELSGIVVTRTGYIVVNDSTDQESNKQVFFLNAQCKVTNTVPYSGAGPRDPEDLALSRDGETLWIADIGDNNFDNDKRRPSLTLWSMPADGSDEPVLHRVSYPQGDTHDAEAMVLDGDGTPLIITKEIGRAAGIYQPTAPLQKNNKTGVPLRRVGELSVSATQTAGNPYARIGNKTITGGAISPAGDKVALRTYTDVLEWNVTDGDVLGALKQKPRTTGLPNEPLGESVAYSVDGKTIYTVSDLNGEEGTNYIQRYTLATTVASAAKGAGEADDGKKWYADLELSDITYAVGAVGVLGLLLVGIGVTGIVRHRKRIAAEPVAAAPEDDDDDFKNPLDGVPATELIGVGGSPQRKPVYGSARSGPAVNGAGPAVNGAGPVANGSGVYGGAGGQRPPAAGAAAGAAAAGQRGSGVYGGGGGAPQYGRPGGAPVRGPQGQPARSPGQPGRPQGQPGRPQGQAAPGGQPPARGGQPPARGPQGKPTSGGGVYGGQPARGPQGQPPARAPQGQPPARAPQGQPPARAPQGQPPARAPQGQPPARAPQGQPPARAPQGQPPTRAPQGEPPRGAQGPPPRGPQGQPPRGAQGGLGRQQPGAYGQPPVGGRPDGGRQRNDYADYGRRPESRFEGFDHR